MTTDIALPDTNTSTIWSWTELEDEDTRPAVRQAARDYTAAGLSVIPIADDGSKGPFWEVLPRLWDEPAKRLRPSWKPFQVLRATEEEMEIWAQDGKPFGLAVVAGQVSGGPPGCGLEVIDFDTAELFAPWAEQVERQAPAWLHV